MSHMRLLAIPFVISDILSSALKLWLYLTVLRKQLHNQEELRKRYPSTMASCVTNSWILHSIRAQNKFSRYYELFRTNTLILQASDDVFVYNRAMSIFATIAPASR